MMINRGFYRPRHVDDDDDDRFLNASRKHTFHVRCLDGSTRDIRVKEKDLESYASFERAITDKLDINAHKDAVDVIIGYNGAILCEENFGLYIFDEDNEETIVVCLCYHDDDSDTNNDIGSNTDNGADYKSTFYSVLQRIATTIIRDNNNNDNDDDPNQVIDDNDENAALPEVPAALVQQLQDLGIPEVRARNALLLTGMDLNRAAEYAFTHSRPEDEVPITPEQYRRARGTGGLRAGAASSRRWRLLSRGRADDLDEENGRRMLMRALYREIWIRPEMLPRLPPRGIRSEGLRRVAPFWEALRADPEFAAAVTEERAVREDFKAFVEDPRGFHSANPVTVEKIGPLFEKYSFLLQ